MKKVYHAGDLFTVPIENAKPIVGLIARVNKSKMLAYFFNPKTENYFDVQHIKKSELLLVNMCSTLGLEKQAWEIIGKLDNWSIDEWPIPVFKRVDVISKECYEISYNDALEEIGTSQVVNCAALEGYPEDGLAGYGFVEKRLAKLLNK